MASVISSFIEMEFIDGNAWVLTEAIVGIRQVGYQIQIILNNGEIIEGQVDADHMVYFKNNIKDMLESEVE